MAVGSSVAPSLQWSTAQLPTLKVIDALPNLPQAPPGGASHLLSNDSDPTAFEVSDGNWEGVAAGLCDFGASSLTSLATAFSTHVLPSSAHADTRRKHWRCWRGILTWAVARRCLHRVLPMSQKVLHALLMELLCLDCSHSTVKASSTVFSRAIECSVSLLLWLARAATNACAEACAAFKAARRPISTQSTALL